MKVKLTWFKDTGKYYTDENIDINIHTESGLYSTGEEFPALFKIWEHVRREYRYNRPGEYCVVDVPEHPHDHPRLIIFKGW